MFAMKQHYSVATAETLLCRQLYFFSARERVRSAVLVRLAKLRSVLCLHMPATDKADDDALGRRSRKPGMICRPLGSARAGGNS